MSNYLRNIVSEYHTIKSVTLCKINQFCLNYLQELIKHPLSYILQTASTWIDSRKVYSIIRWISRIVTSDIRI